MKEKTKSIRIATAAGTVTGKFILPKNSVCLLTLAHGAGAGMDHPFMEELAEKLAERNIATLRFNFPFMEKKSRRPDSPVVAQQAIEAALKHAKKTTKKLPVFLSGKSFGGRMSSHYLSANPEAAVSGIIFFGFPLHAPGKPGTERGEHLKKIRHPMLFLSGTRDEFARTDLLKKVCRKLPTAELKTIKDANHAFKAGKTKVIELLATLTEEWITALKL